MSKDIAISIKIPIRLVELIDQQIKEAGFQNRSEFIRDAIRKSLDESKTDSEPYSKSKGMEQT